MKTYIGTKIIQAKPATNIESAAIKENCPVETQVAIFRNKGIAEQEGYHVKYPDNYESWSPKEVFEEAYRECDGMTFGLAIEAMKKGHKVARKGWNGKGMFIYIQEGRKTYFHNLKWEVQKQLTNEKVTDKDGRVTICSHIDMKTTDGSLVIGWLASQTDMLSEDWYIVG